MYFLTFTSLKRYARMKKKINFFLKGDDMKKRVVLVSGGIDSTIAYDYFKHNGDGFINIPCFCDYGQPYLEKELRAVKKLFEGESLEIIKVENQVTSDSQNPFIPARNLVFASIATMRFNPDEIIMGGLKDDNVPDKNKEAFKKMSLLLSEFSKKEIEVLSPFWEYTKGQIVEMFLKRGGNPKRLLNAVSCYAENGENGEHCNDCPACFRRYVALKSNDIDVKPPTKRIIEIYLNKIWRYDEDRRARTFISIRHLYADFVAYDIDGVLTNEISGHDYKNRTGRNEYIERCNRDFNEGKLVVLFTSRMFSDREVTELWLKEVHVQYHSLITGKLPYLSLYDDRAFHVPALRETRL